MTNMTKQTEASSTERALKLALEALENHPGNYKLSKAECAEYRAVEDVIREALALVNEVDQEQPAPATELREQEPMTYRCAVMGEGKVALGGCKRSTDGLPGIVYLDMAGEQREIDADTTDLFPVGSAIEPSRVLAAVHFLTAESVQQSIDVLREILEGDFGATSPPASQSRSDVKPLTLGQKQRLWSSVGDKPTLKDRVNAYGTAIEAAHGITKEQT